MGARKIVLILRLLFPATMLWLMLWLGLTAALVGLGLQIAAGPVTAFEYGQHLPAVGLLFVAGVVIVRTWTQVFAGRGRLGAVEASVAVALFFLAVAVLFGAANWWIDNGDPYAFRTDPAVAARVNYRTSLGYGAEASVAAGEASLCRDVVRCAIALPPRPRGRDHGYSVFDRGNEAIALPCPGKTITRSFMAGKGGGMWMIQIRGQKAFVSVPDPSRGHLLPPQALAQSLSDWAAHFQGQYDRAEKAITTLQQRPGLAYLPLFVYQAAMDMAGSSPNYFQPIKLWAWLLEMSLTFLKFALVAAFVTALTTRSATAPKPRRRTAKARHRTQPAPPTELPDQE